MTRAAILVSVLACASCRKAPTEPAHLRIAAASDLTETFNELALTFEQREGRKIDFTFGSSGLLSTQLVEGAPFDLYVAANRAFVDAAVKGGACDEATITTMAHGRLALWPPGIELASLPTLKGKIAIANPQHAPYGKAAREALEHAGLWQGIENRLVFADNVRQALQFADTGNVDAAFVAYSNVAERDAGTVSLIEAEFHQPIEQIAVVCVHGRARTEALRFVEFLKSAEAKSVLRRHGFEL